MEKREIIESLDRLINHIDVLKAESGPKSNDFIKWVREVKQFIEKAFGSEHSQLRAFKKIDYYPKQFDILSSESAFKKAWIDGLMQAKNILESLKYDVSGVPKEEKKEEPAAAAPAETQKQPEKAAEIPAAAPVSAKETPIPKINLKTEEKKPAEKKESVSKEKKVVLANIENAKLNEDIFMFIKKMGYEPVVSDYSTEGDAFVTDILKNSIDGDTVYAIVYWKGDLECGGKKFPKPCVIFGTGYYIAKLTAKKVLIISYDDIDCYDENYSGLNFLAIDNIRELMELKLAKEMDAAGLDIDFNIFKKK